MSAPLLRLAYGGQCWKIAAAEHISPRQECQMKARPDFSVIAVAALALVSFAPAAFAYLDPSTGSMILSAVIGVLATAGLVLKNYWYKLKSFFRGGKSTATDAEDSKQAEAAARESAE
jgi:hypothetical protein